MKKRKNRDNSQKIWKNIKNSRFEKFTRSIANSLKFLFINDKKKRIYYFFIVFILTLFPILSYPKIYGVDAFQLIWIARIIENKSLFSENSWLISIWSFFGYYPFSHRAIGVPFIFSVFLKVFKILNLGIEEAILTFNLLLIIIFFFSVYKLANKIFFKPWYKFLFIVSIIFAPFSINNFNMTLSSRIFITVLTIFLMLISLEILNKNKLTFKNILSMIILFIFGLFTHRLWTIAFITIFSAIFTIKCVKRQKLSLYLIYLSIPISLFLLFIGSNFLPIDERKILSPFFDNSMVFGMIFNYIIHYMLENGLLFIFYPIGVFSIWNNLFSLFRKINSKGKKEIKNKNSNINNRELFYFYLLIINTFFFFSLFTFYAIVIFLPVILIISTIGIRELSIILKKGLNLSVLNKKIKIENNHFITFLLFFCSILYTILYEITWYSINCWFYCVIFIIFYFIGIFLLKYLSKCKIRAEFIKEIRNLFNKTIIVISIIIFSLTTSLGRIGIAEESSFPWNNGYLTVEEQKIIDFFQDRSLNGIIFVAPNNVANRISGVGGLPALHDKIYVGKAIYYNLITPEEVKNRTKIADISQILQMRPFYYNYTNPGRELYLLVKDLNLTKNMDYLKLKEMNIQYIISVNPFYYGQFYEPLLIEYSINTLKEPVFKTEHLVIHQIF